MKCDKCKKEITGQYHYNKDKKDEGKKFCSLHCMHEYYGEPCEECRKKSAQWLTSPDKNDDKKFCSNYCMQTYYRKEGKGSDSSEGGGNSSSDSNGNGWIMGGVVILVILIILGVVFSSKKKK